MKRLRIVLLMWVALLAGAGQWALGASAAAPTTQSASVRNLLAHGSDDVFWLARVTVVPNEVPTAYQTHITFRAANSPTWQHLMPTDLPNRVMMLGHSGTQLAVLLDNGQLLMISDDGTGPPGQLLAGQARFLSLASDGDTLWAAGTAPLAPPATQPADTRPSTVESTLAAPATRPSAGVVLYTLKDEGWTPDIGPALPADILPDASVSLGIVDHIPWLAVRRPAEIEVFEQTAGAWRSVKSIPLTQGGDVPSVFHLLSGLAPATLWIGEGPNDRVIQFRAEHDGGIRETVLSAAAAPLSDRTVDYAIHSIRQLGIVNDALVEQDYDASTLQPQTKPTTIAMPAPSTPAIFSNVFNLLLFCALTFAIFMSTRRRQDLAEGTSDLENIVLADGLRRLAAGVIDLFPFIVPLAFLLQFLRLPNPQAANPDAARLLALVNKSGVAAMAIYIFYTAASEGLTGRTLGKWLFSLRVVKTDGTTPDLGSLLIRNFLRIVDLGLMGMPLVFIAFSPLRQRIGDVAAGTIVIRDRARPEGNLIEPKTETPPLQPVEPVEPPEPAGE